MSYCEKCGTKLSDEAVFCSNCGNKKNDIKKNSTAEKTKEIKLFSDKALMVLSTNKKEGVLKSIPCYLVFYKDRIIITHISKEKQNSEMKALQQRIKSEGKGFFAGSAEMMKYWINYGDRYYDMSIADIMNEDSKNLEIRNLQVTKFIFKTVQRAKSDTKDNPGSIEIQTDGNKLKFIHKYSDNNKKIKNVLDSLNFNKFKYKGSGFGLTINIGDNKDGFN